MTIELTKEHAIKSTRMTGIKEILKGIAVIGLGALIYHGGMVGYRLIGEKVTRAEELIAERHFERVNSLDLAIRFDPKKGEYEVKSVRDMDKDELKQALAIVLDKLQRSGDIILQAKEYLKLSTGEVVGGE